jgi:hypothetical protein
MVLGFLTTPYQPVTFQSFERNNMIFNFKNTYIWMWKETDLVYSVIFLERQKTYNSTGTQNRRAPGYNPDAFPL